MKSQLAYLNLYPPKYSASGGVSYAAKKYIDIKNTTKCYYVIVYELEIQFFLWFPADVGALPLCYPPIISREADRLVNMHAKHIREVLDSGAVKEHKYLKHPEFPAAPPKQVLEYDPLREAISRVDGQYYIPQQVWQRWA